MTSHMGEGWGTGKAGAWARGLHRGVAEAAKCPDLRLLHWSHHGHGETGESCLREEKQEEN